MMKPQRHGEAHSEHSGWFTGLENAVYIVVFVVLTVVKHSFQGKETLECTQYLSLNDIRYKIRECERAFVNICIVIFQA
jgi:hypothetical protein